MTVASALMSADDLAAMEPDEFHCELMRGKLIQTPVAGFRHGVVVATLIQRLYGHAAKKNLGVVGGRGGFLLTRDPDTVLAPDVVFVRHSNVPPIDEQEGYPNLAPDLVAEVLSPSDRPGHVRDKVAAYLDAGVRLVLLVDNRHHTVTLRGPNNVQTSLTEADELDLGDIVPGFRLPVSEIFQ